MAEEFECFCGEQADTRQDLVQHNVTQHQMSLEDSQRAVDEKYPIAM